MPTPSATFSPFAMQKSTSSSSRSDGRRSSTALRAGSADDVGEEEDPQLARERERRRGPDLDRDVVARVVRVPRERLLARRRSGRSPLRDGVCDAVTVAPTASDSSASTCVSETTTDGALRRLDVDPLAVLAAVDDVRRHADDAAVDRRVHRGAREPRRRRARSCAGPRRRGSGTRPARGPPPPKSLWPSRASSPSFACRPTGSQRERAVAGARGSRSP